MKKTIIVIIFTSFFLISKQGLAQEVYAKITYKKKSNTILKKSDEKETIVTKMLKDAHDNMNNLEYTLLFNEKYALFKEVDKMELDKQTGISYTLSKLFGETNGVFFTDRFSGKTMLQKEFESDLFLIENSKITDWNLTQEKKMIGNFLCYKATKKDTFINSSGEKNPYEVIAWYTPKLPYPYGPTKYNGLPGLILELNNRQANIYVSKIELNPKEKNKISKLKKGISVTKKEYDNIVMGLATDFRKKHKRN
jgi:GLPGLI family protein